MSARDSVLGGPNSPGAKKAREQSKLDRQRIFGSERENDFVQTSKALGDWRRMCLSNDLMLAAYMVSLGHPWSLHMPEDSHAWVMSLGDSKYVSRFRHSTRDEKILYLTMLARAARHGAVIHGGFMPAPWKEFIRGMYVRS